MLVYTFQSMHFWCVVIVQTRAAVDQFSACPLPLGAIAGDLLTLSVQEVGQ